jgi:hypothetical protein
MQGEVKARSELYPRDRDERFRRPLAWCVAFVAHDRGGEADFAADARQEQREPEAAGVPAPPCRPPGNA